MKTLTTKRLMLVPPSLAYVDDIFEYAKDPVFCRYIDAEPAQTTDDAVKYLESLMLGNENGKRLEGREKWRCQKNPLPGGGKPGRRCNHYGI